MFLNDLASKKQRLLQIVRILRENHQFELPLDSSHQLRQLDEHYSNVQTQIQENSPFNSYHKDPLYAKAVLITEAVRLLFEIAPRRRKKKGVQESTNQQETNMKTLNEKAGKAKPDFLDVDKDGNKKESFKKAVADKKKAHKLDEKAKPDFLDVDKDGDKKEPFKKAVADKKKAAKLDEKWDAEMHTAEKDVGKWDGYTIAELKARKKKLMDKEERSAKEQKEVRQINFAIRAKQENSFGKIKESSVGEARQDAQTEKEMADAVANYPASEIKYGKTKKAKGSQPYMIGTYHRNKTGSAHADMPGVKYSSIPKSKLREDETLDKAETLLAAKDISDRLQNMAEDAAKMAVDRLMPLVDTMKSQFGQPAADGFNEVVKAQLQTVLDTIIAAKDQTDNAILAIQGGQTPTAATDMGAELPAEMPGAEGGEPGAEAPSEMPGEEGEFSATPAASGPEEEPMGRARKEPVAEARKKCMECNEGIMEKKGDRMVCNECGHSMIAEKLTKKMTAGEVISDFVHSDDPKFKGKTKAERTKMALGAYYGMHPEKSKMEESALAEQTKIVQQLVKQHKKLQESFEAHKQAFAQNPNRVDPLNLGYGLEGDSIRIQLRSVRRELEEAVAARNEIKQTLAENQQIQAITQAKIQKLNEQAQSFSYGVLAITSDNKKVKKFFESADHRARWLDYNSSKIQEHRLIDPQDVDQAKQRLSRSIGK